MLRLRQFIPIKRACSVVPIDAPNQQLNEVFMFCNLADPISNGTPANSQPNTLAWSLQMVDYPLL